MSRSEVARSEVVGTIDPVDENVGLRQHSNSDASVPVSISKITKRYGSFTALNDVSLHVESGEFLTLLGPSGSGKTTLLMTIAGFIRPNAGSVKLGGEEVIAKPPHKRGVGMVFQSYALFPHMNVFANVAFALRLQRRPKNEIADRVAWALDLVRLSRLGDRDIGQLSGGQRQRVAIARAIVFEPPVLLMDEPLSALDKKLREQMQVELRRLHDTLGTTTIYVTHDQREALTMSDRVAVMDHARICQVGTPHEVYNRPVNQFVADFIGESTLLPVKITDGMPTYAGMVLQTPDLPPDNDTAPVLMLRPENLRLSDDPSCKSENVFRGRIADIIYQGESTCVRVTLDHTGDEILVRRSSAEISAELGAKSIGDTIAVVALRDCAVLIMGKA